MPLRDHVLPPISKRWSWEGFHGVWPVAMVQKLVGQLPPSYVAEPHVHLGSFFEIDVCTFEDDTGGEPYSSSQREANGGVATATWAPPAPTLTLDVDIPEQYGYEVLVFDLDRDRQLVAAVEIVSPANKYRPDSRQVFVAKCASLLQKGVCVSIVDLVTVRRYNLYAELLALFERTDPSLGTDPPSIYAATCRNRKPGHKTKLDIWSWPLAISQALPIIPIWLTETQAVSLDLEVAYEEACRALRIV